MIYPYVNILYVCDIFNTTYNKCYIFKDIDLAREFILNFKNDTDDKFTISNVKFKHINDIQVAYMELLDKPFEDLEVLNSITESDILNKVI